VRPILTPN